MPLGAFSFYHAACKLRTGCSGPPTVRLASLDGNIIATSRDGIQPTFAPVCPIQRPARPAVPNPGCRRKRAPPTGKSFRVLRTDPPRREPQKTAAFDWHAVSLTAGNSAKKSVAEPPYPIPVVAYQRRPGRFQRYKRHCQCQVSRELESFAGCASDFT